MIEIVELYRDKISLTSTHNILAVGIVADINMFVFVVDVIWDQYGRSGIYNRL